MVPKLNGSWRICVDYTDLSKAYPKDSFPLPKIHRLVDPTAGHAPLSFMDAYYGFHQISMWPEDQDKTSFITEKLRALWLAEDALRPSQCTSHLSAANKHGLLAATGTKHGLH